MPPDVVTQGDHSGLLIERAVEMVDGEAQIRIGAERFPLHLGGKPVTEFAARWHPKRLFLGFAPLLLLEFENEEGKSGLWFLDHRFHHVAGAASDLPADLRELFDVRSLAVLREIASFLITTKPKSLGPVAEAFMKLDPGTRELLGLPSADRLFPRPKSYIVDDFASGQAPLVIPADRSGSARPMRHEHLASGFGIDWQDRLIEGFRCGALFWPSPIDGEPLACRGSVIFDDFHFLFRFVDERFDLVFYAMVGDHRSCVGGLWFPSLSVMISENDYRRGMGLQLRWAMPHWLTKHVLRWSEELSAYFDAPVTRFANVLRGHPGVHIGHQIWNELTGISEIVDRVPNADLLHLVLGENRGIELYGPIDEIFPAIKGKVRRDLASHAAMIADAYASGTIVCRATQDRVTTALRDRLLHHAGILASRADISFPSQSMILFGLRVENRTLVNLSRFLHRFMSMIDESFPELAVVFDGHNASGGTDSPISSHGESMARVPPHVVELELVDQLRKDFPHRRALILDTIMQPISTSLAWADASRGFVSIWGASLAKYRWVANLPGFIISSAHNLHHRHDLNIYHALRYVEDPAPVEFVDPGLVTDRPEAEQLVPVGGSQPSFSNFELDEPVVLEAIRAFLHRCLDADPWLAKSA